MLSNPPIYNTLNNKEIERHRSHTMRPEIQLYTLAHPLTHQNQIPNKHLTIIKNTQQSQNYTKPQQKL